MALTSIEARIVAIEQLEEKENEVLNGTTNKLKDNMEPSDDECEGSIRE